MSQQQQVQQQQQPVRERQVQEREPRYGGGGGGGGGERRGGPKDYGPEDVSQIFQLLQRISESYFLKASHQPIPEGAIRDLHVVVFEKLAKGTRDKAELIAFLRHLADHANEERLGRSQQMTDEEAGEAIQGTIQRIRGKIFPTYPDE